jgi:hypothetical protein
MEITGLLLVDFAGGSSSLVGRPRWLVVLAGQLSSLFRLAFILRNGF